MKGVLNMEAIDVLSETTTMKSWQQVLADEIQQTYFQNLWYQIQQERESGIKIYPPEKDVFHAFRMAKFDEIRVVILGQDPYHGEHQAHGLAFSVSEGITFPPSLRNIFKELRDDIAGFQIPMHGCLNQWAEQGVLLLNHVLTVREGSPNSHAKIGWEQFTDAIIRKLNDERQHLVFMLWGASAQKKGDLICRNKHLVLTAAHPSPLSAYRGFFGCKHFSQANDYLRQHGLREIDWHL